MRHGNVRRGAANTKVPSEIAVIDSGTGYAGSVLKTILASGGNWQRDGVDIAGATATTYTMTFADEGHQISYLVSPGGVRSNIIEMFMPDDISGLSLWLDAKDTSRITFSSGALMSALASRIGGGSFTQATAGSQPSWSATGRNGKPAFVMTTGKVMAFSAPLSLPGGTNPSTTFGLAYMSALAANYRTWIGWGSGNSVGQYRAVGKNSSGNRCLVLGAAELLSATTVTWLDQDRLLAAINKTGGAELTIDGEHQTTDATNVNTGTIAYCNFGMGRNNDPRQMEGTVHETFVYSAALSEADRQRCEGYLAHRWGELGRLPTGHPYKVTAPRIS